MADSSDELDASSSSREAQEGQPAREAIHSRSRRAGMGWAEYKSIQRAVIKA
jgi:hypothetical protein